MGVTERAYDPNAYADSPKHDPFAGDKPPHTGGSSGTTKGESNIENTWGIRSLDMTRSLRVSFEDEDSPTNFWGGASDEDEGEDEENKEPTNGSKNVNYDENKSQQQHQRRQR